MLDSTTANKKAPAPQPAARRWLDRAWLLWLLILLVYGIAQYRHGAFCQYSATDFRGYYASAQIAWQHGFAQVYHQQTQDEFQARLPLRCPDGTLAPPLLRVSMPYLPAFTLFLLPLPAVDFSLSYLLWTAASLLVLVLYSAYFCRSLTGNVNWLKLFQWVICLPLFATLSLGQMNVFLVVCLGEFTLAMLRGKELRSGLWLAGLLLKPHTLILLLPGLLLARRWKALGGFMVGCGLALAISFLLAGKEGMQGMLRMVGQFASPGFETAPTMMNWRALALNLQTFTSGWLAWAVAAAGMTAVAIVCMVMWQSQRDQLFRKGKNASQAGETGTLADSERRRSFRLVWLVLATYAATLTIAWHSHFYMLLPAIPLLAYLDHEGQMPVGLLAAWICGPVILYFLLSWVSPEWARQGLGVGMMVLGLGVFWGSRLVFEPDYGWIRHK